MQQICLMWQTMWLRFFIAARHGCCNLGCSAYIVEVSQTNKYPSSALPGAFCDFGASIILLELRVLDSGGEDNLPALLGEPKLARFICTRTPEQLRRCLPRANFVIPEMWTILLYQLVCGLLTVVNCYTKYNGRCYRDEAWLLTKLL